MVCVLVAGVPIVLVPAGTAPTTTAVTSGTVDTLWWPGAGSLTQTIAGTSHDPVRAWLDPASVWEVYKATQPSKGDAKVDALTFDLLDPAGAATAILSAPRARVAQLLAADASSTDTTIYLDATASIPGTGVAYVGREAVIYAGVGGGGVTPCTRGRFGSRARSHRFDASSPLTVVCSAATSPWPRHWYGRLATVFLARLVGTTLYDPTPIYCGTVGPGVQRSSKGTRWQIPIDSIVETLGRKVTPRTVTLYGWNHLPYPGMARSPLDTDDVRLLRSSGAPHRDGWHPDAASFVQDWNAWAVAVSSSHRAYLTDGHIQVRATGLTAGAAFLVGALWEPNGGIPATADGGGVALWISHDEAPDTVTCLDGPVPLPAPGDAAKIPATLFVGSGDPGARFVLRAKCDSGAEVDAVVEGSYTNGTIAYVELAALLPASSDRERERATVISRRTVATLGVQASGNATDALYDGALLLDTLDGGLHEDVIDWTQIAQAMASAPLAGIPSARAFTFGTSDKDTIVAALTQELRLRGMALCTRRGRLSAFRTGVFASTEETVATIAETDVLCDDNGIPIEPEVIDSPSPVVTSVRYTLPGGASIQWVDDTARGEFGEGDTMDCTALEHAPPDSDISGVVTAIQQSAQQLLGVLAEPYRVVRVTLGPRFLGLQEGDLVVFSHARVPTQLGTLGVTSATCQVEEVRLQVMGGKGRLIAALRLQEPDLAGYAPEVLVAAGGISGAVVTVDTTSAWGATCFARTTRADGSAGDPLDGFTVGDYVVLSQIGTRTPITEEGFTISAISGSTVTLSGSPSGAMVTAATGAYGVVLRFADWTVIDAGAATPRDRQERYLYVSDGTDLGSGDAPKRWAA